MYLDTLPYHHFTPFNLKKSDTGYNEGYNGFPP